jgi:hypothetical protein
VGHAHSSVRLGDTWAPCSLPALSNGHAQRLGAARGDMPLPSAERWTCPVLAAARGHLGIMSSARTVRWTCPTIAGCPGGHAHTWRCAMNVPSGCGLPEDMLTSAAGRRACLVSAGGPEGYAQSLLWREDTWASCSLLTLSDGHAPRMRAAREDMLTIRAERWTCSAVAGCPGRHAQSG